jgi:hypothetical protein
MSLLNRLPTDILFTIRAYVLPDDYPLSSSEPEEWGKQALAQSLSRDVAEHKTYQWHKKIHNFYFVYTMPRLKTRFQRCVMPDSFYREYALRDLSADKQYNNHDNAQVYFGKHCFWVLKK